MASDASTYVINARIEVDIRNGVPLGKVLQQMQQQILSMQQDPHENASGDADWWVGIRTSDAQVGYENMGDQIAAERGVLAGPDSHLVTAPTTHQGRAIDARNNIPAGEQS